MTAIRDGASEEYQELTVELSRDPSSGVDRTYAVVARFPSGDAATGSFVNPVGDRELLAARTNTPPPTKMLQRSVSWESVDPVKEIGAKLFDALFQGSVWRLYEHVRSSRERVRIRVVADGDAMSLPWELLYDRHREDFLALSTRSPLVRMVTSPTSPPGVPVDPPVRVLIAYGDVTGRIRGSEEIERIRQHDRNGVLAVDVLDGGDATLAGLREGLRRRRYDVVHIIANGVDVNGRQYLLLPRNGRSQDREPWQDGQQIDRDRLAAVFATGESPRLVVMNACSTDLLAAALAETVPAVIGIRGSITEDAALTFSERFYVALLEGKPLEAAVTSARLAVDASEPGGREWSAAVFYLRSQSGEFLSALRRGPSEELPDAASGRVANDLSRESQVLVSLLELHESNVAALTAQRQQFGSATPEYLEQQLELAKREAEGIRAKLAAGSVPEGPSA